MGPARERHRMSAASDIDNGQSDELVATVASSATYKDDAGAMMPKSDVTG